jgi:hypothetical protein
MPGMRRRYRDFARAAWAVATALGVGLADAADPAWVEAGRRIYVDGLLADGRPLEGRAAGLTLRGPDAACVRCHRASGLGGPEGAVWVPPIAGPDLFGPRAAPAGPARLAPGITTVPTVADRRTAYTQQTLGRALRHGLAPDGLTLHAPMPRYALGTSDLRALTAYLRQLSARPSPGVEGQRLHLATVVAPDADGRDAAGMVEVLRKCLPERVGAGQDGLPDATLHVWQLEGEPSSWAAQLDARLARQPVFALVGGLGATTWAPVQEVCERERVPCLFPQAPVPGDAAGRYTFYLSGGVVLEAALIAHALATASPAPTTRVVQVHAGDVGAAGARALQAAIERTGGTVSTHAWAGTAADPPPAVLAGLRPDDVLVLWLPRDRWPAWSAAVPRPPAGAVYASGLMADVDRVDLPPAWRRATRFSYLLDPPARRELRMQRNLRPFLAGLDVGGADERVLGNALAACQLLGESVVKLQGRWLRERLVELVETYPSAMGNAPAAQAYPRFELGVGQRVGSRGGYLVRFADEATPALQPLTGWVVP